MFTQIYIQMCVCICMLIYNKLLNKQYIKVYLTCSILKLRAFLSRVCCVKKMHTQSLDSFISVFNSFWQQLVCPTTQSLLYMHVHYTILIFGQRLVPKNVGRSVQPSSQNWFIAHRLDCMLADLRATCQSRAHLIGSLLGLREVTCSCLQDRGLGKSQSLIRACRQI